MSHAKMVLYWSVIQYQMTFERHSGCGSETSTDNNNLTASRDDSEQPGYLPGLWFGLIIYVPGNNVSAMLGRVFFTP